MPKAVAGDLIFLHWALVPLLGIWQSLNAHSSKSNQHQTLSVGPSSLWWGQLNPHPRSQPFTLGSVWEVLNPFHTTQMLREIKGSTSNSTTGLCLYCNSLALPYMVMRRPLYIADTSKSSKWRDRHKSTLILGFLTSITIIGTLSPSESPILNFSQEEGGQNMDLFPLPIQSATTRQKSDLERTL